MKSLFNWYIKRLNWRLNQFSDKLRGYDFYWQTRPNWIPLETAKLPVNNVKAQPPTQRTTGTKIRQCFEVSCKMVNWNEMIFFFWSVVGDTISKAFIYVQLWIFILFLLVFRELRLYCLLSAWIFCLFKINLDILCFLPKTGISRVGSQYQWCPYLFQINHIITLEIKFSSLVCIISMCAALLDAGVSARTLQPIRAQVNSVEHARSPIKWANHSPFTHFSDGPW